MPRRRSRAIPLQYDDGFRGAIATAASIPLLVLGVVGSRSRVGDQYHDLGVLFAGLCGALIVFFLVYMIWTHRLYASTPRATLFRIAKTQHHRGSSVYSWLIGMRSAADWGLSSAVVALLVSGTAAVLGTGSGNMWLPFIVLLTVGLAWGSLVYAFALRYLRLHAAGETFSFDIAEAPRFGDFLSTSIMVSSMGALSAGTPRTRASLTAVRTHTLISFGFNTLIIAMTVSLLAGLISGG